MRNRAEAWGLALLATIATAGAVLALAGHGAGPFVLLTMAGVGLGTTLVHLSTRPPRARRPAAVLALLVILAFLLAPFVGLWLGVGWLVYPSMFSGAPSGIFLYGLAIGAGQAAFARLVGRGPREDG